MAREQDNCDWPNANTKKSLTKGISRYQLLAGNNQSISVKDLMSEIQTNGPVAANIFLCNNMINFLYATPSTPPKTPALLNYARL